MTSRTVFKISLSSALVDSLDSLAKLWGVTRDEAAETLLTRMVVRAAEAPMCKRCGCTEFDACETDAGPCAWADRECDLCTACVDVAELHYTGLSIPRAKR